LKSIRTNLRAPDPSNDIAERISLPSVAQKSFFDALGLLWMLELRICFQNADKEENISKYVTVSATTFSIEWN
jgi:hypothetical protein